jgi:hypothetical protein
VAQTYGHRSRLAFEEAAHGVIAKLEGLVVLGIELDPPRTYWLPPDGYVEAGEKGSHRWVPSNARDPAQRVWVPKAARTLLAGALTQVALGGIPHAHDMEQASQLVLTLQLLDEDDCDRSGRYLDRLMSQTAYRLSEYWGAVELVAGQLQADGQVGGARLGELIQDWKYNGLRAQPVQSFGEWLQSNFSAQALEARR